MKMNRQDFLDKMLGKVESDQCSVCHQKVDIDNDFKDIESVREWNLSKLCQECQDKVFECPNSAQ